MNGNGEMRQAMAKHAAADLMRRAKKARAQTNRAFRDIVAKLETTENTLQGLMGPVSKFLVNHCGLEEGKPLPLWTDLYDALCTALPDKVSRETSDGDTPA